MQLGPGCKTTIEWATAFSWQKRKWSNFPQWCLRPNSVYGTCIGGDSTGCLLKSWTFPSLIKLIHVPNKQRRGSRCECWSESWVGFYPSPWAGRVKTDLTRLLQRPCCRPTSCSPAPTSADLLPLHNYTHTHTHTHIRRYCGHTGPHTCKYSKVAQRGQKVKAAVERAPFKWG